MDHQNPSQPRRPAPRHSRRTPARHAPPPQPALPARPQAVIEHDLRERLKELECLYTISSLCEMHLHSADRFLQGVVECLPRSWQYPEFACARIIYGQRQYVTESFRQTDWRMSADIRANGSVVGVVEVCYRNGVPAGEGDAEGPFLREEQPLIRAVAERVGAALTLMSAEADLQDANKTLQRQHEAMQETNTALRVVLSRLEEEKRAIRSAVLANIQKIIMPIVFELELEVAGRQRSYVTLLRKSLQEIASPFMTQVATNHVQLTPVEIAVSTMIRNGLSTKEIAQLRCTSPATVRRHRENIRRKLGLRNRKANLVTYLQASAAEQSDYAAGGPPGESPAHTLPRPSTGIPSAPILNPGDSFLPPSHRP